MGGVIKQQMQDWHIVFQEEDKDIYIRATLSQVIDANPEASHAAT